MRQDLEHLIHQITLTANTKVTRKMEERENDNIATDETRSDTAEDALSSSTAGAGGVVSPAVAKKRLLPMELRVSGLRLGPFVVASLVERDDKTLTRSCWGNAMMAETPSCCETANV